MHSLRSTFFLLFTFLLTTSLFAADDKNEKPPLDDKEKAFVELLTGAKLTGSFTMRGQDKAIPQSESYEIVSVEKVQLDPAQKSYWLINSRMKFAQVDVVIPVPINVYWADDTPVMSLTSATIPGLGSEFGCRVLFYENEYAGTWSHGKKGGHMFGKIEKMKTEKPVTAPPAVQK